MFLKWKEHIDRKAGEITYTVWYKDDDVVIKATVYPCEHPVNMAKKQWACWASIFVKEEGYDHGLSDNQTAYHNRHHAMEAVQDYIKRSSYIIKKKQKSERFIAWLKDDSSKIEIA